MQEPSDQGKTGKTGANGPKSSVRLSRVEATSKIRVVPLGRAVEEQVAAEHFVANTPAPESDTLARYQKIAPTPAPTKRLSRLGKLGLLAAGLCGVVALLLYPAKHTPSNTATIAPTSDTPERSVVKSPEFIFEPTLVQSTGTTPSPEALPDQAPDPTAIEIAAPQAPEPVPTVPVISIEQDVTPIEADIAETAEAPEIAPIDPSHVTHEAPVLASGSVPDVNLTTSDQPEPDPGEAPVDLAVLAEPETTLVIEAPEPVIARSPTDEPDWQTGLVTDLVTGTVAALRAPDAKLGAVATIIRKAQQQGATDAELREILNSAHKRGEVDIPAEFLTANGKVDLDAILSQLGNAG